MKVLIVSTEKLPVPPVKGGAIQTYISGAVPSLKQNHSITILGRQDETLPDKETKDGIQYVRVPGGLLETYRAGVVEYIKDQSFDLIHIFNRPRLVLPIREVAPKSRIILSMHNDMFKREKISPEEGKEAIAQLDKIITISNYIGEEIVKLFPEAENKVKTIYSGVDLDRFVPVYSNKGRNIRASMRQQHQLGSKKVILFAGRLSANKGADILLRSMEDLSKKFPDIALVLMGAKGFSDNRMSDYIAYIKSIADRLPIPVITTGFVQPDQIQDWFATADIFVCPSQWEEPLARVHYEAMAAGLPIVTTARGGNPEVIEVGKNGYIVETPEDSQEFVTHISKLLSNPSLCKKMGEYGRQFAEENHNWDRVISDISAVWSEIEYKIKHNIALEVTDEELESLELPNQDLPKDKEETEDSAIVLEEKEIEIQEKEEAPKPRQPRTVAEYFNYMFFMNRRNPFFSDIDLSLDEEIEQSIVIMEEMEEEMEKEEKREATKPVSPDNKEEKTSPIEEEVPRPPKKKVRKKPSESKPWINKEVIVEKRK
ncbi:glycosyltransferase family 4 protein [Bacillus sp. RO2]|uniref:glycosyltransferase family 4 protein n=1 Tax=Bacillus sp. RO2 TaxID=2723913 RepID=UPI00145C4954|nr:glycosyltransferase family 4 protein [Bacillus sp. RO2]NMH73625.1 glycosyltransferase family 4 protein [Bacillus sp. RO2]